MRIDAYTHFFPKPFFDRMMEIAGEYKDMGKRVRSLPALYDLDHRKKMVDMYPDYQQILSYPQPPLEVFAPDKIDELCKLINDGFAELIEKERDHCPGWVAQVSLAGTGAFTLHRPRQRSAKTAIAARGEFTEQSLEITKMILGRGVLLASILPPCITTSLSTSANPIPKPP